MPRLRKWTLLSLMIWIGCGSVAPGPEGGTAGSAGAGADAAAGAAGTAGATGAGGSGAAGRGGTTGTAGTTGAAGAGGSGAAGRGGTTGTGGGGGSGVACGALTCQPGENCCFDIMGGNPTCAAPPAVCVGAPQNCNSQMACPSGLFCDMNQPRRCLASAVGGICIEPPTACDHRYDPVCGCDGMTYGNDCMRRMAKVQLDHVGECSGG
jgi:hypothetical protein